jgi:hypothetical protein
MKIKLPPLPEPDFAFDQGDEPCYYAHTLRARDLEVARAVQEACANVCQNERIPFSDDEWRVRCELAEALRSLEFDV